MVNRWQAALLLHPGEIVFHEGDRSSCAYLIETGEVEIVIERAGKVCVLGRRRAGEIIGEMGIIGDAPRSATVRAVTTSTLAMITREQLMWRVGQVDPVVRTCLSVLIDRFRATISAVEEVANDTAPDRDASPAHPGPTVEGEAEREIRLEHALREALQYEEFETHYQPIVRMSDGRIVGFEALVRWRHRERGLVMPGAFLPTAEASGLIGPIGKQVMGQAFAAIGQRATMAGRSGQLPVFVSVNLSARDILAPDFVAGMKDALARAGIEASMVKLEITETLLMENPEAAAARLRLLKEMGFSIAIDDFGTGYSSLSYLHRFPIDTIKIDRSFVRDLAERGDGYDILESILTLAAKLGLQVVAEGIETTEQARILRKLGCGFGQGYLFGRPTREAVTDLSAAAA